MYKLNIKYTKVILLIFCFVLFIIGFPNIIVHANSNILLRYENGGMEFFNQSTYDNYKKNNLLPTQFNGSVIPLTIKKGYQHLLFELQAVYSEESCSIWQLQEYGRELF